MSINKFAGVQQLGRALMLPIAVLPVAGLLLRLGQPDLMNIAIVAQAGDAIFSNLALIFAIGVAVGFARENNGTAGLAGAIGFLIMTAVLKSHDDKINMGVLSGIISGLLAGGLYNRYKDIKLPPYLAFFGGKRFVPIVTGLASLLLGILFSYIWPPIQHVIDLTGHWLISAGGIGLFVYGVLNRLLIVTGLHHILNSLVWFVFGSFPDAAGKIATGDLNRFFAGDPSAGAFMAGYFPVMMFGLPAACLAMYHCAKPENKTAVGGLLLSMALTSFLTGVTEPVEFGFMFLAPVLYGVHAVLTGLSLAIMHALHVRLGFAFSAGLFDYLLSYGKGENPLLMLPVGLAYAVVYYCIFRFAIRRFNLMTLGREEAVAPVAEAVHGDSARAHAYIAALGGADNLKSVDACTTRLRLQVEDGARVDERALKALGARGLIRPAAGSVQVVIGPEADLVAEAIRQALAGGAPAPVPAPAGTAFDRAAWCAALGGEGNIFRVEAVAGTRLRIEVGDSSRVDAGAIKALGAVDVVTFSSTLLHVVLPGDADSVVAGLGR